jgi:MFS family permease
LGSLPPRGFYGALERDSRVKHRNLDVQRSVRLADDKPQSGSSDGIARPGRNDLAHVSVRASGGRAGRYIFDRRQLLMMAEIGITAVSTIFAILVWLDAVTPASLLVFTFLAGVGGALMAPAWQSTVPQLVPKRDLHPAVVLNGIGVNISRAVGPALGGIITAAWGIAAPFWINAVSNLGVIGALLWWRSPQKGAGHLPAERFWSAMRNGLRYARHNPHLRATLMRALGFFLFASAYWALLPLVARNQIVGGPELYGVLLGAIGLGAVVGAFGLPWLKARLGPNGLSAAGTIGTAVTLILFGIASNAATALLASIIAGFSWIIVLSALNVSAQVALPEWVRGRGLSLYVSPVRGDDRR